MNGTTPVNTVDPYVIIHRIKVLTWGISGPNIGTIKATAATDGTVTAQINAGDEEGQTQMAIYGIPSLQSLYIIHYYASALKAAATTNALIKLVVNEQPQNTPIGFITKHTNGIETSGSNDADHPFKPYFKVAGPAIIKLQVDSGAANLDVSGGFDGVLIDNEV